METLHIDVTGRHVYAHNERTGEDRNVTEPAEDWPLCIDRIWSAQRRGAFGVDEAESLVFRANAWRDAERRLAERDKAKLSPWAKGEW